MANKRIQSIKSAAAAQLQNANNLATGGEFSYTGPGGKDLRSRLVQGAAAYQGVNYQWGGADPRGFDCSGLVQYVYGKMGVKMPRVSQQQAQQGRLTPVTSLRPGDLVGWGSSPATAHHIAVYAGNGMVWEAPHRGAQVRLRRVNPTERGIMGIALNLG
jgi:cell wall-associated NlpC family hydrolase